MNTSAYIESVPPLAIGTIRFCVALAAALLLGSTGSASAQGQTLTGVWAQVITPRSCETNQPLPVPPFRALLTFHRDRKRRGARIRCRAALYRARHVGAHRWLDVPRANSRDDPI
jgi:hypothetical protein